MELKSVLTELQERLEGWNIAEREIVVWGMGHTTMLYSNAFKTAKVNIFAYTSKDTRGYYEGKKIISTDEILKPEKPFVVICVKQPNFLHQIKEQIESMKSEIPYMTVDEFFFALGADLIIENLTLLADEKSKNVYKNLIMKRIENVRRI